MKRRLTTSSYRMPDDLRKRMLRLKRRFPQLSWSAEIVRLLRKRVAELEKL